MSSEKTVAEYVVYEVYRNVKLESENMIRREVRFVDRCHDHGVCCNEAECSIAILRSLLETPLWIDAMIYVTQQIQHYHRGSQDYDCTVNDVEDISKREYPNRLDILIAAHWACEREYRLCVNQPLTHKFSRQESIIPTSSKIGLLIIISLVSALKV